MYSFVICMSLVCTHMSSFYYLYVLACHPFVTRSTCMSSVCHLYVFVWHPYSYVLVCHPYVTCTYSHVNRMSLVLYSHVTRMYSYVTRMYLYVIRMSLVCTCMSSLCQPDVLVVIHMPLAYCFPTNHSELC